MMMREFDYGKGKAQRIALQRKVFSVLVMR